MTKHTNDEPPRYCTNHQGVYPVAGGVWPHAALDLRQLPRAA